MMAERMSLEREPSNLIEGLLVLNIVSGKVVWNSTLILCRPVKGKLLSWYSFVGSLFPSGFSVPIRKEWDTVKAFVNSEPSSCVPTPKEGDPRRPYVLCWLKS